MNIVFYETTKTQEALLKKKFPRQKLRFFPHWVTEKIIPPKDTEVLSIHSHSRIDSKVIAALPNLKYIVTRTAGFDHVDLVTCAKRKILASNVPGQNATAVAEHAFALALAVIRDLPEAVREVKKGLFDDDFHVGTELAGKTIGIAGTGAIGLKVAAIAKGFGMNVIAWDLFKKPKLANELGFRYVTQDKLFQNSDIVTLHVPATIETKHMINAKTLQMMKPGSVLINTARGSLVDHGALLKALTSKKLAAAALDVIDEEPAFAAKTIGKLPPGRRKNAQTIKKLIALKNVLVTPHMAHATTESIDRIFEGTISTLEAYLDGQPINLLK